MKTEDTVNNFSNSLISMAGIFPYLEDDFFAQKLHSKMNIFITEYIEFSKREEESSVAQYYLVEKLISGTDDILETFELIDYLKIIKKTTPLLLAGQKFLSLKLEFLKIKNSLAVDLRKKESITATSVNKSDNKIKMPNSNTAVPPKNRRQNIELNPSKEKILNFIRKSPNIRTKDIIHEFNALSDRTVKRNLGELLRVGLINRKIENKAVYYSAEN